MSDLTGGCACGKVRFQISGAPLGVGVCHCRQCQYSTGGGPNYVALVLRPAFEVTQGEPKRYSSPGGSGAEVVRTFCADCGTPLFSDPVTAPFLAVKVGGLDDPAAITPGMHIWTIDAPAWHVMTPGLPAFERGPPGA